MSSPFAHVVESSQNSSCAEHGMTVARVSDDEGCLLAITADSSPCERLYSRSDRRDESALFSLNIAPAASHGKPIPRNSNIMHQAQVQEWGQAPKCIEASETAPEPDETRITVLATGVHQVVRSRAAGKHYSSGTPPHVPGVDGVGKTDDGQLVYWFSMECGTMADHVNIPKRNVRSLPKRTDPIQAAGIVNPALSSWMAFKTRTENLPEDFTVLIVGATSASGRVAISLSRALGAKKVIGAARNKSVLDTLGLDTTVVLADKPEDTKWSSLGDVDVILDYVYGPVTAHLLASLNSRRPTQYVHIGGLSGQKLFLPGAILRSKNLTIRGSGPGAWRMQDVAESIDELLEVVKGIPEQPIKLVKLKDTEAVWDEPVTAGRLVIEP
ncbi:hypothetical protein LTR74_010286 [Friedmanniomyces endolithicus]|nr:hypothetical protein LTR74_010286 [Friedmanniomyces endolithicus]